MNGKRPEARGSEARRGNYPFLNRRDFTDPAPSLQDDEIESIRRIWWSLRRNGSNVAAEPGVILIDGGRT
jgi:hypothetical protein